MTSRAGWVNAVRAARFATIVPGLWLFALALSDGLGANPIEKLIRETGTWALIALSASLSVTPLRTLGGWLAWPGVQNLAPLRRTFGLSAFCYALLHFCAYAVWDQGLDLEEIIRDVLKRPFITLGMASLLLLSALAATSPKAIVRRLGGQRWRRLHRLVYLVAALVLLHFAWHKAGKNDFTRPLAYAGAIALGFGVRLLALRAASRTHRTQGRAHDAGRIDAKKLP